MYGVKLDRVDSDDWPPSWFVLHLRYNWRTCLLHDRTCPVSTSIQFVSYYQRCHKIFSILEVMFWKGYSLFAWLYWWNIYYVKLLIVYPVLIRIIQSYFSEFLFYIIKMLSRLEWNIPRNRDNLPSNHSMQCVSCTPRVL